MMLKTNEILKKFAAHGVGHNASESLRKVATVAFSAACFCASAGVMIVGTTKPVIEETPAASTGLNSIYVLPGVTQETAIVYSASDASAEVKWLAFDSQGGGYAYEIEGVEHRGTTTSLTGSNLLTDKGYIIEEGTTRTYFWVVNYAQHELSLNAITASGERSCGEATLYVDGEGKDITYYTINGAPRTLSRGITLTYNSLEWNDEDKRWQEVEKEKVYDGLKKTIVLDAPLCDTDFTLKGDRFLQFWKEGYECNTDVWKTSAVDARTWAVQEDREVKNEVNIQRGDAMGGSAPVVITFTAVPTDAVMHREWQMAKDPDFMMLEMRLANEDEVQQTINEAGTTYWRYYAADASGECETYGETFVVNVGESKLDCPNAFSPGASEGVNDEWKVSYRSIVEFKCWIFNRWGVEVCRLTDPSQGWDGRYKGKLVPSGTYYYVIEARGADGQNYKLKGDINIINFDSSRRGTGGGNE